MTTRPRVHPVHPLDIFGLRPLGEGLRQCRKAIVGAPLAPPSKWGPSSLRILRPGLALPLWLGRSRRDRKAVIMNLPNRVDPPSAEHETAVGYSVRCTYARDYRGRRLTYDSHIGTDFAVPPGTAVVAAAPGVVRRIERRLERGGLKVCVDHGDGLATTSGHLAEATARPGDRVERGDVIGLSGMSGVDGILFCPWLPPHVHFNVLLDGIPVDPFAVDDEVCLWRRGPQPTPDDGSPALAAKPTEWDHAAVDALIVGCRSDAIRSHLDGIADRDQRAFEALVQRTFEPYVFTDRVTDPLTRRRNPRRPTLDLPFAAADYDGVIYADTGAAR